MLIPAARFVIASLFASLVFGQPATEQRVFHFTQAETVKDMQEIATLIRFVTEIQQSTVDTEQQTLAIEGANGKIAIAEWLFTELDKPLQPGQGSAKHEYRILDGGDDVVRVFYLTTTDTVQKFQEVATLVRSIGDIRVLFTYNAPKAVAIRGTSSQVALAAWLFTELDRSPQQNDAPVKHEYWMPDGGDDVVRVFYLPHAESVRDFQQVTTMVRTIGDLRKMFTYNAPRAEAARGPAGQLALAEWLFNELDKPGDRQQGQDWAVREYHLSGTPESGVRVFYLTHPVSEQGFRDIATQVRLKTEVRRIFTCDAPRAMTLRQPIHLG